MQKVNVKIQSRVVGDYAVFAVISPKGGIRVVGSEMQLPSDAPLFETLATGAQYGSIELTIQEMRRIAELGVEVKASASTVAQAPVAEASVGVRKLETIDQAVMVPHIQGDDLTYVEEEVTKSAWQCLGCGLCWGIKWHAETCESRGHKSQWEQMYSSGTENGKPINPRYFPRVALRRQAVA